MFSVSVQAMREFHQMYSLYHQNIGGLSYFKFCGFNHYYLVLIRKDTYDCYLKMFLFIRIMVSFS